MIRLSCTNLLTSPDFYIFVKPLTCSSSPSSSEKSWLWVKPELQLLIFHSLSHKNSFFFENFWWRHCMWFAVWPSPNQNPGYAYAFIRLESAYQKRLLHLCIVTRTYRVFAYNIVKVQNISCIASTLKVVWYVTMEWNVEENFSTWNGRFLVWNGNGMEKNCQYGIWKNHLPFHSIPCPA